MAAATEGPTPASEAKPNFTSPPKPDNMDTLVLESGEMDAIAEGVVSKVTLRPGDELFCEELDGAPLDLNEEPSNFMDDVEETPVKLHKMPGQRDFGQGSGLADVAESPNCDKGGCFKAGLGFLTMYQSISLYRHACSGETFWDPEAFKHDVTCLIDIV